MSSGRILLIIFPQSSLNWPSSYQNKPVPLFWRKANKTSLYFWKAICHEILGVIHWLLYFKIGTFNSVITSFSWLDYFFLVNIQSYTFTFIITSSINSHKPFPFPYSFSFPFSFSFSFLFHFLFLFLFFIFFFCFSFFNFSFLFCFLPFLFSLKAVQCFLLTRCLQEIKLMKYMMVFYLYENWSSK